MQMLATVVAAALQHVEEALEIGVDIDMRIVHRIAHAGLGGEMDDLRKTVLQEQVRGRGAVGQVARDEAESGSRSSSATRARLRAGS